MFSSADIVWSSGVPLLDVEIGLSKLQSFILINGLYIILVHKNYVSAHQNNEDTDPRIFFKF